MKETAFAIGKVCGVNCATIAVINLANVKDLATIILTVLSIAWTIHQWRKDNKK